MNNTKSKHTPGPWYIDETYGLIMWQDKEVAAIHAGRNGDARANAALIAAAPDLLAACEIILTNSSTLDLSNPYHKAIQDAAFAAIAKAKGGA